MKNIFVFILLVFLGFALMPGQGQTAGLVPCGPGTTKATCELCDFFVMFDRIIKFFLVPAADINGGLPIVPVIATLMIAVGGFMYVVAHLGGAVQLEGGKGGGPQLISRAKKLFGSVIIGLLIVYGAWLIVETFFWVIGATIWSGGGNWWTIPC